MLQVGWDNVACGVNYPRRHKHTHTPTPTHTHTHTNTHTHTHLLTHTNTPLTCRPYCCLPQAVDHVRLFDTFTPTEVGFAGRARYVSFACKRLNHP